MKENKNIDQLLTNLDQYLDLDNDNTTVNIKDIAQKYHDKKISEQIGNSKNIIGLFLIGISVFLLSHSLIEKINIIILWIVLVITYWLNLKAKKEIETQNLAVSLNEFKNQRKNIANALLKQFKGLRIAFYFATLLGAGINIYDYLKDPSTLKLVVYIITISIGATLVYQSIESAIKEYQELIKDQN